MKNDTIINSSWRNFNSPEDVNAKIGVRTSLSNSPNASSNSNGNTKPIKPSVSSERIKGANMPPNASKFHNNQKLIDTKFKQQSKSMSLEQKAMYQSASNSEWQKMEEILSSKDINKVHRFISQVEMARNLNPSRGRKFKIDKTGTRRLSSDFARIVSKIAEDNSGNIIDGNDNWDMDKLVYRAVDNRSILNCKSSRELESILLMLDSSPSCESYAKLYSELASVATLYDDVDMYNAPNARITHRYDSKKREFTKCMRLNDLKNDAPRWAYFKNRVVMFFGDFDGKSIVLENTFRNKVYWFCTEGNNDIQYELRHSKGYNKDNLIIFPRIRNSKDFIKAMKKIR